MTDRRLLLVRHGVTDWNREGRFQGHMDPPLATDGEVEASLLADRLAADPELRPDRIVTSTLARARQTAEPIAGAAGVAIEEDRRLIEIGQGEWEGRTHADLAVSDADRYAAWRDARGIRQPPGGEAIAAATARVSALLDELDAVPAPSVICLVSHGGTLRIIAALLLAVPGEPRWSLDVDNASFGALARSGDAWRLERWNDTLHLLGRIATHVDEAEGRPLAL